MLDIYLKPEEISFRIGANQPYDERTFKVCTAINKESADNAVRVISAEIEAMDKRHTASFVLEELKKLT